MTLPLHERARRALAVAEKTLLAARGPEGHWVGRLSSSALSTATAVCALGIVDKTRFQARTDAGLKWLSENANADGGWGDTTVSLSNLSTTTLGWAAFKAAGESAPRAERWIVERIGSLENLPTAIIARYGKDRTFSVPILTMCALAGTVGWGDVIPLPFELSACPHSWFAALRLPVVSYALPALIAMGLARHVHLPSRNPLARLMRSAAGNRALEKLKQIQPPNGGFLEATPLTSFVTMSLAGSGMNEHPVVERAVDFLERSQRTDGSWPIDTNLATWITTLSVNALSDPPNVSSWLIKQQYVETHPYTHARPGGWAWTDLPGGVPDADDTAGALLALRKLGADRSHAEAGIGWLLSLQNTDGGIPTFCRGWGTLPFDRSSPDITAHALRAWKAWGLTPHHKTDRALAFLKRTQREDGSWSPLWFGNQHHPHEENPTYGTSRVLLALAEYPDQCSPEIARGADWLRQNQEDSVEETALALEALAKLGIHSDAIRRRAEWLIERIERDEWQKPSPIGFYFARLWYYEELYPLIFSTAALREVTALAARDKTAL